MGSLCPIAFVILSKYAPLVGGLGSLGRLCAGATKQKMLLDALVSCKSAKEMAYWND